MYAILFDKYESFPKYMQKIPKKLKKKHLKVIDAVISFYCTDVVNVRRLSNVKKKKAIVVQHFKNEFQSLFSGSMGS